LYGAHFPLSIDERAGFRPAARLFLNKVYKGRRDLTSRSPPKIVVRFAQNRTFEFGGSAELAVFSPKGEKIRAFLRLMR